MVLSRVASPCHREALTISRSTRGFAWTWNCTNLNQSFQIPFFGCYCLFVRSFARNSGIRPLDVKDTPSLFQSPSAYRLHNFVFLIRSLTSSSLQPSLNESSQALNNVAEASSSSNEGLKVRGGADAGGVDIGLLLYFALWYLGNYYVSRIYCEVKTRAVGGKEILLTSLCSLPWFIDLRQPQRSATTATNTVIFHLTKNDRLNFDIGLLTLIFAVQHHQQIGIKCCWRKDWFPHGYFESSTWCR